MRYKENNGEVVTSCRSLLHGITTQKIAFFIATAVTISGYGKFIFVRLALRQ